MPAFNDADAFDRATAPLLRILSRDQAKQIADYRGHEALHQRIEELAGKANEGDLSETERAEYEGTFTRTTSSRPCRRKCGGCWLLMDQASRSAGRGLQLSGVGPLRLRFLLKRQLELPTTTVKMDGEGSRRAWSHRLSASPVFNRASKDDATAAFATEMNLRHAVSFPIALIDTRPLYCHRVLFPRGGPVKVRLQTLEIAAWRELV